MAPDEALYRQLQPLLLEDCFEFGNADTPAMAWIARHLSEPIGTDAKSPSYLNKGHAKTSRDG